MTDSAPSRGKKKLSQTEVAERRRAARVAAVQALYEHDLTGAPIEDVLREFLNDRWLRRVSDDEDGNDSRPAAPAFHHSLFIEIVRGTLARQGAVDEMLNAALAPARSAARIEAILRAILRAGIYEMADRKNVPARTVIDEYVAIAGGFYAGKEPGMVNAILDRLAWTLRVDELEASKGERPAPER